MCVLEYTYVVTTGDANDVALELVSERVDGDLLSHALLVKDAAVMGTISKFCVSIDDSRRGSVV